MSSVCSLTKKQILDIFCLKSDWKEESVPAGVSCLKRSASVQEKRSYMFCQQIWEGPWKPNGLFLMVHLPKLSCMNLPIRFIYLLTEGACPRSFRPTSTPDCNHREQWDSFSFYFVNVTETFTHVLSHLTCLVQTKAKNLFIQRIVVLNYENICWSCLIFSGFSFSGKREAETREYLFFFLQHEK